MRLSSTTSPGIALGTSALALLVAAWIGCSNPVDDGTGGESSSEVFASSGFTVSTTGAGGPTCKTVKDCTTTIGDCQRATCTNSQCGVEALPPGPVPVDPSPGDCLKRVCDSAGTPTNVPDDTDVPKSTSPCSTLTCSNGMVKQTNASPGTNCGAATCTLNTEHAASTCNDQGTCEAGAATACAPYACNADACKTTCTTDGDCVSPNTCDTALGRCTTGPHCTDYCNEMGLDCTTANSMYAQPSDCLAVCALLPAGTVADMTGENTVGCRLYQGGTPAVNDAATHCPAAGPAGESVCGTDCESFCIIAGAACTGANQAFPDTATCLSACALFPTTPQYSAAVTSGDSFACRMFYLTEAASDPAAHCSQIGATSSACHP